MKKSILGIFAATLLAGMLCACGAKVEVDPPIVSDTPNMTDTGSDLGGNNTSANDGSRMGQSNGLAQGDGMQ